MEKEFEVRDMRIKEKFFVDDEYLNGYAKLCGISATGVYFVLCRHADKKQECFPSKKLIAEKLGITERTVYSAIKILEEWRIIERREQGRKSNGSFKNHIYILLDKKKWKTKPQANITVGKKRHYPSANNDTTRRQSFPNKDTHIKDTHIKDIAETSSAPEINLLLKEFEEINPTINYGNKTERKTLEELIKKWGYEKTLNTIKFAVSVQGKKYSPTITKPTQLKNKMGELLVFHKKESGNPVIVSI